MSIGVVIDLCALVLLISLIVSLCYRNKLWSSADRVFLILMVICTVCTAADVVTLFANIKATDYSYSILYASSYIYFLFRNITPFMYICYIITLTEKWGVMRRRPFFLYTLLLPMLASVCLIASNPWTKGVFYYDAEHVYHRGQLLTLLYIIAMYYMLYSMLYTYRNRILIEREKVYSIYSFIPISMGSVVIQMLYPEWVVELFGTALCLMLIMFTLQKKEEVMEGNTGLWNRKAFIQEVGKSFAGEKEFTVISINISNMSLLGRTIGVTQTEQVVGEIVQFIKRYRTEVNNIYVMKDGRYEMILCGKKREKQEEIAASLNRAFKQPWMHQGLELNLIVYVAITECPKDFRDKEELLQFTDTFHRSGAFSGEVLYAGDFNSNRLNSQELEKIIERTWQNKGFEVYYQPIYSVKEGRFKSAEALLRLYDEEHGFISPMEFIPIAEENMSILKIGQLVLETVCEFIASEYLDAMGIDFIEINLSAVQCIQEDMADKIIKTIKSYGVDPSRINFEITETAAIYSSEIMLKNMEKLGREGISFSLDDFGSGYANINYLLNFPFSIIKLDREMVSWEKQSEKSIVALKYSIKMLKEMGYYIVAEGMEDAEHARLLSEKGCDYQQGYFFSRPLPAKDFLKFLTENRDGMYLDKQAEGSAV